jgi:branched-subunit amino acid ABC-type transport system permease component
MNLFVFLALLQDGLTTGAIYVLLAVGLLIVFSVTRVIFVPQGDLLALATLTVAALESDAIPGTLWMMDGLAVAALLADVIAARALPARRAFAWRLLYPALVTGAALLGPRTAPAFAIALGLAIVVPLGPLIWRLAFQPAAESSVLTLLILAMALHFLLIGAGMVLFGPDGASLPPLTAASFALGPLTVSGQSLCVLAACALLVIALRWFFGTTIEGKALRAAASSRLGARLVGIDQARSGAIAFGLAAFVAGVSGVLIGAITPIAYDTGFEIGLKGFVAAIVGGLVSYPAAAAGAVLVGVLESLGSFWSSAYRDVIVFASLIPVLAWLSLRGGGAEEQN